MILACAGRYFYLPDCDILTMSFLSSTVCFSQANGNTAADETRVTLVQHSINKVPRIRILWMYMIPDPSLLMIHFELF